MRQLFSLVCFLVVSAPMGIGCSPDKIFGTAQTADQAGTGEPKNELAEMVSSVGDKIKTAVATPTPVTVNITYSEPRGYEEQATSLAVEIAKAAPHAVIEFTPKQEDLGLFSVTFNDIEVWFKYNAFPKADALIAKLPK